MNQHINLFNPDFCIKPQYFTAWVMVQGLALLIVVAAMCYAYARHQVSELEAQVTISEMKLVAERDQLLHFIAESGQKMGSTLLEDELKRFNTRLSMKQTIVQVLDADTLGNTDGYSEYMRAFARQLLSGLWLTGFMISNVEMVLTGNLVQADLMPTYLQRLRNEKIMQGRSFSALQINAPEAELLESAESEASTASASDYLEFSLSSIGIENER